MNGFSDVIGFLFPPILVNELIRIGRQDHFLGKEDSQHDERMEHVRAREIGAILNRRGGMSLMRKAHEKVRRARLYPGAERELEVIWNGIGHWRR